MLSQRSFRRVRRRRADLRFSGGQVHPRHSAGPLVYQSSSLSSANCFATCVTSIRNATWRLHRARRSKLNTSVDQPSIRPLKERLAVLEGEGLLLEAGELSEMFDRLATDLNQTSQTEPRPADLLIPSSPMSAFLTPVTPSSGPNPFEPIGFEPPVEETPLTDRSSCHQTSVIFPQQTEAAFDSTDGVSPESFAGTSTSSAPVSAQATSESEIVATTSEQPHEFTSDHIASTTAELSIVRMTESDHAARSHHVASQALELPASEPVIGTRVFETETAMAGPANALLIPSVEPAGTLPIHPEATVVVNHGTRDTDVDAVAPSHAAPLFMDSSLARLLLARPTPSATPPDGLEADWEKTLSIRCPTCNAAQHPATECRRCKCDLSLHRMCIEQQLQLRQRILYQIHAGHYPAAAQAAWLLLHLSSDAETLRLVAVAQLLAGDFATAVSLVDNTTTAGTAT
jgi:hypothetical protein